MRKIKGRPVENRDTTIAGTGLSRKASLVTRNTAHFSDLDLRLIDPWSEEPRNRREFSFVLFGETARETSSQQSATQSEPVHLVAALLDHLIFVNPHITVPRQYIHMRPRFPIGVRLASVRISKRDVHPGEFLILQ